MSPAYAGLKNTNTLFLDYRSEWSGVDGGPVTYQMSYNTRFNKKVGLGGRFLYDKTDIFKQTLLLGTYSYEVQISENNFVNFGISAGFFHNSIDLAKYFSNPDYVVDNTLTSGLIKSKVKFSSDASVMWRFRNFESGLMLSNLMFGSLKYNDPDISYKPFKNYMIHGSYNYTLNESIDLKPFILLRGGKNAPDQLELAMAATYNKKAWGTLLYRTGGVWGFGVGAEPIKSLIIGYSYNLSSGVALNTFGNHQITLGVKIFDLLIKAKPVSN
jgi:type IX secretion system PorP/SprF family membrane protein